MSLRELLSKSRLRFVGVFVLGALLALGISWWLGSAATYGTIHVETPEIYTRERLVNDRYSQDYWLRTRLAALDEVGDLSSGYLAIAINANVGGGLGERPSEDKEAVPEAESETNADDPPKASIPLPFQEDLSLRLSVRDFLRQQILENMLDDRHDLSGNTVFGLKFDTSVIPGVRTHNAAYVRASVSIFDFKNLLEEVPTDNGGTVKRYQYDYYTHYRDARFRDSTQYGLYMEWLNDFQIRLNRYAAGVIKKECAERNVNWTFDKQTAQRIAREVFSLVAGLVPETVIALGPNFDPGGTYNLLPGDLYDYIDVAISSGATTHPSSCTDGVQISINPRIENLDVIERKSREIESLAQTTRPHLDRILQGLNREYSVAGVYDATDFVAPSDAQQNLCSINAGAQYSLMKREGLISLVDYQILAARRHRIGRYDLNADLIPVMLQLGARQMRRTGASAPRSQVSNSPDPAITAAVNAIRVAGRSEEEKMWAIIDAFSPTCVIELPIGYFNFVEKIAMSESYAYAIFPKSDRKVFKLQELVSLAARGSAEKSDVGGLSGMFGVAQVLDGSDTIALSLGYSDGADDEADPEADTPSGAADAHSETAGSIERGGAKFGWVILPEGGRQFGDPILSPTQKSQLALVSVPTFAREIIVDVETGWLDDDAKPIAGHIRSYRRQHIRVPADYEAVDSLLAFGGGNRRPLAIGTEIVPQQLRSCDPGKLLIPGFRLWQSTTVTLGSQQADRITVLPNMEGIIAEFEMVPRVSVDGSSALPVDVPLRVWTSEGVTEPVYIRVVRGDNRKCEAAKHAKAQ